MGRRGQGADEREEGITAIEPPDVRLELVAGVSDPGHRPQPGEAVRVRAAAEPRGE